MNVVVVILALTLTALQAADDRVSYDGYHTLSVVVPRGQTVGDVLHDLFDVHEPKRHIISLGDRPPVSYLLVAPFLVPEVKRSLEVSGVKYEVLHKNAQQFVDREHQANVKAREEALLQSDGKLPTKAPEYYMDFNEVNKWLDQTASANSNKAKIEVVGKSYEGNPLKLIKIGSGDASKPSIWIDGGIHSREWISISTAVWVIDSLLQDTAVAREMLDKYVWYIMPVSNPDGYQYSHDRERYWRKTRRPTNKDPNCIGADPNRNWDVAFGTTGVSKNPCSDIWPGDFAFSEPCMKVMSAAVAARPNLRLYVNMHSFMQIILTPYGYAKKYPPDVAEITRVAEAAAKTIQSTHGREFTIGSPPDVLYAASGSTMDWVKANGHAKYTYGPELRPESFIEGGFILPPVPHIKESGEEWFGAFVTMAREMKP